MGEQEMSALHAIQRDVRLSEEEIAQLLGLSSPAWVSNWMESGEIAATDAERLWRWHAHFLRRWPELLPIERHRELTQWPNGLPSILSQLAPADPDADVVPAEGLVCGVTALVPPARNGLIAPPGSTIAAHQVVHVYLPRVIGTRDALRDQLKEDKVPDNLGESVAIVLCSEMVAGSRIAADELVANLLSFRNALGLGLVASSGKFRDHILDAARERQVTERLMGEVPVWMVP